VFQGSASKLKAAKVPTAARSLQKMFEADLADEKDAFEICKDAAGEARDIRPRDLFDRTALHEAGHMTWLELHQSLLGRMGEPAFIAMQVNHDAAH